MMEFLYFLWRGMGRSLYLILFFYYFCIDYIINSKGKDSLKASWGLGLGYLLHSRPDASFGGTWDLVEEVGRLKYIY
jgi:hypothetical protein